MGVFDRHIRDLRDFSRSMRGRECSHREFECRGSAEALHQALPIKVGEGANPGIILRGDTFLELGNPAAGSCSHLVWTDDPALIRDGRVTLFGPDIPESKGSSLPFAQILMLAGEDLGPSDHERLQQAPIVGDQIEGYMVRSTENNLWCRVGRDVAARGFDFEMLGRALLALVKSGTPGVTAMEVLFVSSSREEVKELSSIAADARVIGSEVLKQAWKDRGYDVDCDFDCSSCHDEEVCDDVRDLLVQIKKKAREKKAHQAEARDDS